MPSNNEMKQTRSAMARVARPSLLISVFYGHGHALHCFAFSRCGVAEDLESPIQTG
jgi:hypothetical protein